MKSQLTKNVWFLWVIGIFSLPPGAGSLAVASDPPSERCEVADFRFTATPSECALLESHGSNVVTFGVQLTDMRIVEQDIVRDSHMIVRLRPVVSRAARGFVMIDGLQPTAVVAGRNVYNSRGFTGYEYRGVDDQPVYVGRGLTTFEGNRIFGNDVEVLYQFDRRRDDLESIDDQLLKLLQRIDVQLISE
ncbi:hypothetical protein ACYZT4_09225 [Pseudomonas sp. GB2N2]